MKKLLALTLVFALTLALCACGAEGSESTPPTSALSSSQVDSSSPAGGSGTGGAAPEDTARSYIQMLIDGQYDESDKLLSEAMKTQLDGMGGTEAFVQSLYGQVGTFQNITGIENLGPQDEYIIIVAGVSTDQSDLSLQVVIDADGKVAGLQVVPGAEDPIEPPEGLVETVITVDAGGGYPLEGRLVKPEASDEAAPLVILIQGSGATNYDEIVGVNRVFGKIAYGLAERGIATLRYDKRNYAYPEIAQASDYTVHDEYVEDVLAAVELAKRQEGIDPQRIYILGHSQGGMLAPMFLSEGADVAGMILFAGTPRSFFDILDDQQADIVEYYENAGLAEQVESYREMQAQWQQERDALLGMTEEQAKQAGTVYGMGAYYLYMLEQYDAIADIKALGVPTLIMQGGADRQVYADKDYQIYIDELSGESYVDFKLYDGLSHLFTPSQAANIVEAMSEYYIAADIPAEVFDDIATWIG